MAAKSKNLSLSAAKGKPYSLVFSNQMHNLFQDTNDHISDIFYADGSWHYQNLDSLVSGAPASKGNPFSVVFSNQMHNLYQDTNDHISDIFYADGSWYYQNLNSLVSDAPNAAGDPCSIVFSRQQHNLYRDVNDHISDIFYAGGWHYQNLNSLASDTPDATGDPCSVVFSGQQHNLYRDVNGNISDIFYAGGWHYQNLNSLASDAPNAAGDPCSIVFSGQQHNLYRDVNGNISDIFYADGSWHYQNLNSLVSDAPDATGDPCSVVFSGQQHNLYRDVNGNISDIFYADGSWHYQNLNSLVSDAPDATGDPCSVVFSGQQHNLYRDVNGNISDIFYADGSWHYQNLNSYIILPVDLIGQKTNMWCWAASGQMTMKYLGHDISQCEQANYRFGYSDCCNSPTPGKCIKGGWPDFGHWGFSYKTTSWGTALSYNDLVNQFKANKPVPFSWGWNGNGGHMMVARGTSPPGMVYINDPWPPNVGDTRWISYTEYVSGSNHVHWRDYYDITYTNTKNVLPSSKESPVEMENKKFVTSSEAAQSGIEMMPHLVFQENYNEMGFNNFEDSKSNLELGEPFKVHFIRHDALKQYSNEGIKDLLIDQNEMIYPILKNNQVVSSVVVGLQSEKWFVKSVGDANLIKEISNTRSTTSKDIKSKKTEFFIVKIPSLYRIFLAHTDADENIMFSHIFEDEQKSYTRSSISNALNVIADIQKDALEDNFSLERENDPGN